MDEAKSNPMVLHVDGGGHAVRTSFGYITKENPGLDRLQNGISFVAGMIAGLSVVAMAVLTCVEVFSRLVIGQPLGWNVAFTERYLLVAGAFFGIVTAYRAGAHVAVASIFSMLPFNVRKILQLATHVIIALIFALIFWYGLQATLNSAQMGEIPPVGATELSIPEWVWRSFIPLGSAMAFVIAAIDFYREITSKWSVIATDYDPGDATLEVTE